jgi:hypothetical protein
LFRHFEEARTMRKGVIQAGQDTAAPNFGRADGAPPLKSGG